MAKFETLGKPNGWAIQEPKFEYKFENLWISKAYSYQIRFYRICTSLKVFLASQIRVFDVSLSSPEAATASARMFHPFIRSWLLLVTTTRDHVNNFITSHLIGSISYSVHRYTNQNSPNSLMVEGIAHRFKKCVTEIKWFSTVKLTYHK